MDENLSEFFLNTALVVFFVIAVTLYFALNGLSNDMADFVRNDISNERDVIRVIGGEEEQEVSGEEIMSDILIGSAVDFDINVNGVITSYALDNLYEFHGYAGMDLNARYTPVPKFDGSGNVTGMEYIRN